jgi:hypothetical protein
VNAGGKSITCLSRITDLMFLKRRDRPGIRIWYEEAIIPEPSR